MNKWTIIAIACMVIGAVTFGVAGATVDFHFNNSPAGAMQYEVTDEFSGLQIDTSSDDVCILPSADGHTVIEWTNGNAEYEIGVRDDVLCILRESGLRDILSVESNDLRVLLPEKEYASLVVKLSSGDVETEAALSFDEIACETSSGDIELAQIRAKRLNAETSSGEIEVDGDVGTLTASTGSGDIDIKGNVDDLSVKTTAGDVKLDNVLAKSVSVETTSGNVEFDNCDGDEFTVNTTSGDVTGHFRTGKMIIPRTSAGDIELPHLTEGHGACEITTTSGNICFR